MKIKDKSKKKLVLYFALVIMILPLSTTLGIPNNNPFFLQNAEAQVVPPNESKTNICGPNAPNFRPIFMTSGSPYSWYQFPNRVFVDTYTEECQSRDRVMTLYPWM